jgi:hypothetical protein
MNYEKMTKRLLRLERAFMLILVFILGLFGGYLLGAHQNPNNHKARTIQVQEIQS